LAIGIGNRQSAIGNRQSAVFKEENSINNKNLMLFPILLLALPVSIALTTLTAFTNIGCNPVCKPGDQDSYITFKDCIQNDINKRRIQDEPPPNFYELYNDACQAKYDVEFQDFMVKNANSWFTLF
jgi:hypothetical protein